MARGLRYVSEWENLLPKSKAIIVNLNKRTFMSKDNRVYNNREVVKKQIMAIRDSGKTNMFDGNAVKRLAYKQDFFELVCFMEDRPLQYAKYILTGNEQYLPK